MTDPNTDKTWYHGSPLKLTILRQGSTVTQNRKLAEVFSHKPPCVSISDDGTVRHNGSLPGYLYSVSEDVQPGDVTPHPNSSMGEGLEWLTTRELHLALIGPVSPVAEDLLTEREIEEMQERDSKGR